MALASIVLTAAVQSMGGVYFSQKKIFVVQSFATETQFLMERLVQLIRTNTIDYDRYFVEVGPPEDDCAAFDVNQIPATGSPTNSAANRLILGYETVFFWDTSGDDVQNRNLGGRNMSGTTDDCTQAWNGDQETLYLINGSRTLRMAIRETLEADPEDENFAKIEIEQQLGADIDGDGVADIWNSEGQWDVDSSGRCEIADGGGTRYEILGTSNSDEVCLQAHDWTSISPDKIEIETLLFSPAPNRDPFLGFAIDESQVHPHVSVFLETTLRDPNSFGMNPDDPATVVPDIVLQTTASSRVFGNTRE